MTFIEERLATNIEFGAVGGPGFRTELAITGGGHEQRNADWSEDRGRWNISPGIKTPADLTNVIAAFRASRGKLHNFRFKDHTDFSVTLQSLIDPVVGGETSIQLVKTYTFGDQTYTRTITKPVAGTLSLFLNGSPYSLGSLDTTTGIATFAALPAGSPDGGILEGTFEFDVPVRFDTDNLPIRQITHQHERIQPIPVIETRI